MRTALLWLGLGCLGYCAYMMGMERLNQSYDNWIFEQHIAGRPDSNVADYLREKSPLGFLAKDVAPPPSQPPQASREHLRIIQGKRRSGKYG